MIDMYILDGTELVLCDDVKAWTEWLADIDQRRVALNKTTMENQVVVEIGTPERVQKPQSHVVDWYTSEEAAKRAYRRSLREANLSPAVDNLWQVPVSIDDERSYVTIHDIGQSHGIARNQVWNVLQKRLMPVVLEHGQDLVLRPMDE